MIPIARPIMEKEEENAVVGVLHSGHLVQGKQVEEFENNFAKYIGTKHAVAVNSGTAALCLSLQALGIKNGDEVITTPFSFIASSNSILSVGAKPVFVDIDSRTFNIDPGKIEEKFSSKTKAILPVHLYGQPADMDSIKKIAKKHNLLVLEDACQAHGAEYKGKKVGSIGDVGCFSFYATKNMITGEGGMITTNSDEIAEKIRMLRSHGEKERYHHTLLGFNFRMTDIAAAIGIEQLKKLDKLNQKRILNAKFLTEKFSTVEEVIPPYVSPEVKHVFHQYTIKLSSCDIPREEIIKKLEVAGIQTKVFYETPIHKQPLYKQLGYNDKLPEAEKASNEVLSLPVHPSLSKNDIEFIVEKIKNILG